MAKTFLVSGAGTGIGRAIAQSLAANPAVELVLLGRRPAPLEETRRSLPRSERHLVVSASQSDRLELHDALESLELPERNLAGVIANAGVGGGNAYGEDDRWDEIIQMNLTGTYLLINECLPALRASSEPVKHVVIVSSILARLGVPGYTAYCASKAGLLGMTRSMASAWASEKIHVNAVCPGWVNTEMAREGIRQFAAASKQTYEQALAMQMAMVPTGRMSEPEEVGGLVAFLVSGSQRSFTGQTIDINNGALMP